MNTTRTIAQILAVISIICGVIPLLPMIDPNIIPAMVAYQNVFFVGLAILLGAASAVKGAKIGWLGLVLGIVYLGIELVQYILISASNQ